MKFYHPDFVGNNPVINQINSGFKVLSNQDKLDFYVASLKEHDLDDGLKLEKDIEVYF